MELCEMIDVGDLKDKPSVVKSRCFWNWIKPEDIKTSSLLKKKGFPIVVE